MELSEQDSFTGSFFFLDAYLPPIYTVLLACGPAVSHGVLPSKPSLSIYHPEYDAIATLKNEEKKMHGNLLLIFWCEGETPTLRCPSLALRGMFLDEGGSE